MKIPLPRSWLPLILVGLAFVAALVVASRYVALLGNPFSAPSASDSTQAAAVLGQLGDYFGGLLNPIVSFLTLIVAVAVWRLQKAEMHETQIAFKKQAETAEQQRVQQRFFDLLNLYHRTVDTVTNNINDGKEGKTHLQGKEALSSFLKGDVVWNTRKPIVDFLREGGIVSNELGLILEEEWKTLDYIDHYFRAIYRLLKESEPLLGEEHFRYVKLLRAQLSKDELSLLGLTCG
jgi:Putative phage abortive infection protein